MKKGKLIRRKGSLIRRKAPLIVFEGADGTGKTTQSKLLLDYLKQNKIPHEYISFPRYEDSMWAAMVRRFLLGEFGKSFDPYLASLIYAGDRLSAAPDIRRWLSERKLVVCNRYVGSNIGHMAAKIKNQKSKIKYIEWLEKLEYGENKIPKEDLVILLQIPPKITKRLMKSRNLDIHERDLNYQEEVFRVYDYVAKHKKYWVVVDCTEKGKILPPKKIHSKVVEVLTRRGLIKQG